MDDATALRPAREYWEGIDLVVFDLDGTLYDAHRMRALMLRELLADAWRARSLATLRALRAFRMEREALAMQDEADFLRLQYPRAARRVGCEPARLEALVQEWMQQRPLPLLRACRRARVAEVFGGLRAAGKQVAVLSDYPARDKLAALGLEADLVVSASDPGVGRLKPHPRGLHVLLLQARVAPQRALMIGDRADRDVAAAQRAHVRPLLLARRGPHGLPRARGFDDPLFRPLLERAAVAAAA